MISFPKKYKTQDLRNRSKIYRDKQINLNTDNQNSIGFCINILPTSSKISYNNFFSIYMSDFFSYKKNIESKQINQNFQHNPSQQLFITYWNQLQNICSSYSFFNKKNQTLTQVWTNKLERYISSRNKKNFNTNKKILDSYLSSPHKVYIPDSNVYIYILNKFRTLREQWKITQKTQIWYRSFDLQTSVPSQNILRKEENVPYYTLKYFVWAKCEALPVCIEDIDLCCGDVALLVHPKDKRYNKYIWKNAIIPLCNRQIPIIWDENVNIAIDNWIKRICPCCDDESIELAKKYWLPTNIYVFNQQWLYTEYIHEPAFIWQERKKYYNNIVWFIEDIGNLSQKWERITKVPYLNYTKERLVPYKIENFIIELTEQKQKILNQIFEWNLRFSFLDKDFTETFKEISYIQNQLDTCTDKPSPNSEIESVQHHETKTGEEFDIKNSNEYEELKQKISKLKQEIIDWIEPYLPDSIICNSQLPYWWKLPIIKDKNEIYSFYNLEKECLEWKDKPLQLCFNFIFLSLIREGTIENKTYEYDKIFSLLFQNEKKIQLFVQHLSNITWTKAEYDEFLHIIRNLFDEISPTTNDCVKLIKNCKYIDQEWTSLIINIEWIPKDVIDPELIHLCIPCYLNDSIKIDDHITMNTGERNKIFKALLIQELLLWKTIFHNFTEYTCLGYDFLWNKQLTKIQIEQSQRDSFLTYWENPIRLNFLINQTYDQKEILLNSIFLKQIRNATRLCIQKDFLPKSIEKCLDQQPEIFENFDSTVLYKTEELYKKRCEITTYEQYTKFFTAFKKDIQNIFFSRYIEMQKVQPTKNVQFVCAYFFNFIFSVLYPIIPEFIDALQYVSKRDFLLPIKPIETWITIDYAMNILFKTFSEVKNLKVDCNIKQHESCKMFIKSNPTILDMLNKYEQIFKSYFHISEITYLRLHEQVPLWYETFTDETSTIWLQSENSIIQTKKDSIETIERDIKNLEDKLDLLRQRIQLLPEWEQRTKAEEEYAQTKEEIETLSIRHSLLSSK